MLTSLLFTVLVGSQVALVCSVFALLVIWWVEWKGGRVW